MSLNSILLENNLVTCSTCDIVIHYVDYLSHSEICNNSLSRENVNTNTQINDDDFYSRIVPDIYNIYNPMIDRGFDNIINNNPIQNEISNESSIDIGLGIENLSLYSTQIPITEESYCVICMTTYEKGSSFYLMKCLHSFCNDCSKRWFDFKSVCPLCKTNMKNI